MAVVIDNYAPVQATDLDANDPVSFDVVSTNGNGFTRLMIVCSFDDDDGVSFAEVVHDGDTFRGNYQGVANRRSAIVDGFRFTVLRGSGWVGAPTIEFFAGEAAP